MDINDSNIRPSVICCEELKTKNEIILGELEIVDGINSQSHKRKYVRGLFFEANKTIGVSGNEYDIRKMKLAVDEYRCNKIFNGNAYGEMITDGVMLNRKNLNLNRCCIHVDDVILIDNKMYGVAEILDNELGRSIYSKCESGKYKITIFPRIFVNSVSSDIKICAFDVGTIEHKN